MATLNDLRTKGGVIVSIVIAIALLAFLLGDLLNSGSSILNSKKMRVGEIDGNTIGYNEYYNETQYITDLYRLMWGVESFTPQQYESIYNTAWEDLIMEYAYKPSFDKLGFMVSEAEQLDMINGKYVSPVITSFFVDPNTGMFNSELLTNFMSNVSSNDQVYNIWSYIKDQMVKQRLSSNFSYLVQAGFYPNKLEIARGVAGAANNVSAQVVKVPYSELPDSLFSSKVSSNEVMAYYKKHKDLYKQTPIRDVDYVVFDLLPSDEDYAEAAKYIGGIAEEFVASETPMQYATLNSQTKPSEAYFSEAQLSTDLAAIAFGAKAGEMYGPVLNGDTYTLARVADIKNLPDTLGARHILLPAGQQERADSLVAVLKNGGDFAELSRQYSLDQNANAQGGDLGRFSPEQMITDFSDACVAAKQGDIFTVNTQYGIHVVELTYKSPLVKKAQIASITYKVDPSETTQQTVYNSASNFLSQSGATGEGFKQAANDLSLSKRTVRVRNTDRTINGLNDAKELIRWAYNNKVGDVSSIMEIDGDYVIATITDAKEYGTASAKDVASVISQKLFNEVKADYVKEQIAGANNIEAVASKLGKEIIDVENVNFDSFYFGDTAIGVEPALVGAITSAEPGNLSEPVSGYDGVYVFQVSARTPVESPATEESMKVRLEADNQSYLGERLQQALYEESDIKDNRVKFF